MMVVILLLFVFTGLLLAGISIPLILGKIPPNGLYGFRVKKTMENPEIWYPVNAYSGKWLLAAGLTHALAAAIIYFIPGLSLDVYAYAVLGVWVVVFGTALTASIRYLNSK
jgi:SdpI/YfhL protein family